MKKEFKLQIRVDEQLKQRIEVEAKKRGLSISSYIRMILTENLK